MQVTELKNEGLKREFEITLLADDINKQVEDKVKSVAKTIKMPGFRSGKVPVSLVKKKHGQQILGEVLEHAVAHSSEKVLEERDIYPAMQPKIEVSEFDEGKDLKYNLSVEIYPEVPEVDLGKIKVKKSVVDVTDKETEEGLERLRGAQKDFNPIKGNRKSKKGDVVLIDFEGKVDGVAFEGGAGKDFKLELGSGQFIPGFEDQLIGAKKGDNVTVKVKFPENYGSKDLAGKDAEFNVDVKDVLEAQLPEVNDEFAKKFGMEDLGKLKEAISEQIAKDFENITRTKLKKDIFDSLDKAYAFEVPQSMVEMEIKSINKMSERDSAGEEKSKKEEEKQQKEFKEIAERRVRLGIILADLGRKNAITVNEDELRKSVFEQARNYPGQEQQVIEFYQKNKDALDQLRGPILEEKVVDFVLSKVKAEEEKVTVDDLIKFNEDGE